MYTWCLAEHIWNTYDTQMQARAINKPVLFRSEFWQTREPYSKFDSKQYSVNGKILPPKKEKQKK